MVILINAASGGFIYSQYATSTPVTSSVSATLTSYYLDTSTNYVNLFSFGNYLGSSGFDFAFLYLEEG